MKRRFHWMRLHDQSPIFSSIHTSGTLKIVLCRYIIITGSDIFIAFKMMVIQLVRLRNPYFLLDRSFVRLFVCLKVFAKELYIENKVIFLTVLAWRWYHSMEMRNNHKWAMITGTWVKWYFTSLLLFYLLASCILNLLFTVNRLITFSNRWMQSFFSSLIKMINIRQFFLFVSFPAFLSLS